MKVLSYSDIIAMDSMAQTAVLEYWNDYSPMSVLLAYAELKRKNFLLPNRAEKGAIDFCKKNDVADIDTFLNSKMKEAGFNSYIEYYQKIYLEKTAKDKLTKNLTPVQATYIRAAGKSLKDIVGIVIIVTLLEIIGIVMFMMADRPSMGLIILFALCGLIGNILVLHRIYTAGDALEKSVS